MAEKLLLVCDICAKPAVETVAFTTSSAKRQKDYCADHLQELMRGSRAPKRGRRPSSTGAAVASSAPRGKKTTASKRSTRKKVATRSKTTTARKKASAKPGYSKNGKRLGRPPGSKNTKTGARKATTLKSG